MNCLLLSFLPQGSEWCIIGLFALAFYGAIFWAIIEFIRYLRRK